MCVYLCVCLFVCVCLSVYIHACACLCVCKKCLRFESALRMCYNDGLSATTAAGICRMSLSAYTEGETNKRTEGVIELARLVQSRRRKEKYLNL